MKCDRKAWWQCFPCVMEQELGLQDGYMLYFVAKQTKFIIYILIIFTVYHQRLQKNFGYSNALIKYSPKMMLYIW